MAEPGRPRFAPDLHMRAPSSKRGPTGRRPGSCRAPAFDTPRVGRLRRGRAGSRRARWPPCSGGGAAIAGVGGTGGANGGHSGGKPVPGQRDVDLVRRAARAAATWRGSRARRTGTGSRPSSSRAPTAATPGASSPEASSPASTPAACASAPGSSSTAATPAPRPSAARRRSARAPTAS